MNSVPAAPLLSPEEIVTRSSGETAHLRFAQIPFEFRDRALRFRQLAAGHSMRDFLVFMADLSDAQHQALNTPRAMPMPSEAALGAAARSGVPPLTPAALQSWGWGDAWQPDLMDMLDRLLALPQMAQVHAVASLRGHSPLYWQQQAERLLSGIMLGLDLGHAPLIAAALQVFWARWVAQIQASFPDLAFGWIDNPRQCPCCGSDPVASVARIGAQEAGTRYLHCSLCQTEWHMVRIKCAHCESTRDLSYRSLTPTADVDLPTHVLPAGAVRAEACGDCGHYLKIMDMAKDAHVDPVADDLATVALDLLLAEAKALRHGVNLLLLWGEPSDETQPPSPSAGAPP